MGALSAEYRGSRERIVRACRAFIVAAAALAASSCSVGNLAFDDLGPADRARFNGTQSGFHRLSEFYASAVSGGSWDLRLIKIYYYPNGSGQKRLIGVARATLFEDADFGPRDEHFAISSDGTAILFFHDADHGFGRLTGMPSGLYLHRHGDEPVWLRPGSARLIGFEEQAAYLGPVRDSSTASR